MPNPRRPSTRVLCAALLASLFVIALALLPSRAGLARAASTGQLKEKISAGQSKVSNLSGIVSAASSRLGHLNASIADLQKQISRIQSDLDAKKRELLKLRGQLDAARTRLSKLEAFESRAESVLSKQLVNSYESDRPDIVTVVLESAGFQDLLERLAFAQRIRKQDVQVVGEVRAARRAVAAQAERLGALEVRQQSLTDEVLQQRNGLARSQVSLVQQQLAVARFHSQKAGELASARGGVAALRSQLTKLEAAQVAAAAARSRALEGSSPSSGSSGSSVGAGQVSSGGGFTFPMPRSAASPPGTWSLDQGVDISAPGGTPELAVCSGTVVLHGIGGFGPWAPVLHCDSPLSGGSYVYYGHAGPANQLAVGSRVSAGQVMSEVGPGIVGISSGPHIEIGFCDASGTPLGGGTASQMMALLQSAYGG
jgi:murein DD-endopeptidase MepM/ murein hydrolase activator NlpD